METAKIGIIGGSGLYQMPELLDVEELEVETPFGRPSDAFMIGTLEGQRVAFIALGANLGPKRRNLLRAMARLQELSDEWLLRSSIWKSEPVDCPPGSPNFVNAVVGLIPRGDEIPESLLRKLQNLEKEFGRTQKKILNESRSLDLDLIAFGNEVRATSELTLPHPRAHLRQFVLQPLAEIAPDLILPGQGRPVSELLKQLTSAEIVRKLP
jgi:2-amino-4-hydroxy-6-hydroxymethyldihydropteridine diphosphokinase